MMLSVEQFIEYKKYNKDLLPELKSIASNMNLKITPKQLYCKSKAINGYNNTKPFVHHNNKPKINIVYKHERKQPTQHVEKNTTDNSMSFHKKINIELNKLSESNTDIIAKKLYQDCNNESFILLLIENIIKKSIEQPKYGYIYAGLCKNIINRNTSNNFFRYVLLNKCQELFSQIITILTNNCNFNESIELITKKEHIDGCITFICNLFNEGIITKRIMLICCETFMEKINESNYLFIDYVILILVEISKTYIMTEIIEKIKKYKDDQNLSKKQQFAIMDLLEKHN